MKESDTTAQEWKKKGDEEFNKGNWSEVLSHYTKAIKLATDDTEKQLYYNNRAAAYFEQGNYDEAIEDCNSVVKICPDVPITLFRRFLALIELERYEEAFEKDADEKIISSYLNDTSCSNDSLHQDTAKQFCDISDKYIKEKVSQMIGLTFNVNAKKEKRENAMITLLKLTRWRNDAYEIFIKEVREDDEVICNSIRIVAGLCKNNVSRTKSTMIKVVLPWCLEMMNSTSTERVNASQYCLQNVLNTYSGMNDEPDSKPNEALCMLHKKEIDTILSCLLDKIKNETTTGIARDALIEFITRNIHYTALDWAKQLINFGGLQTLMKVASQLKEYQHESSLDITSSTQTITSVCLAKIYENLYNDYAKKFFDIIIDFFGDELDLTTVTSNVRAIVAMTTLTFGPFNVAKTFITEDGLADMIVDFLMETGNDLLIRKVICEFIYAVVTKYDAFNTFIRRGFTILQDLCHLAPNDSKDPDNSTDLDNSENLDNSKDSHDSENLKDSIRIQAFVGICKMTKFTMLEDKLQAVLTFDKEQIGTWLKVCIRFLTNSQRDMRKWAVEGLSYLTLDLGVKDDLIQDQQAVQEIIEFAKTESQSILYRVDILLVNLCSAYDKDDFIIERERFVNYFNFDKDHIRAKDDYVGERRRVLAEAGVISALVSLAKTGSENSKELIARVFNAICSQHDLRKIVIQEGGMEALLSLALNGTDTGMIYATRALAYLAFTTSPKVAFPGQIIMEVVQPISNLLNPERSVNERCDALTALCNLASVNNMREHIFKTEYEKIELCMRDDNNLLKQTSIQLINNLVLCRDVAIQLVKQRSDQLFDLMSRSVKDGTDDHTKKAIAETLATLTAASEEACKKLLGWDIWSTFLPILLNDPDDNLQHKGTEIVLNMMNSMKDVAAKLIETDTIMKRVRELSDNNTMQNKEIKELASRVLEAAAKWGKLKRDIEESGLSQSTDNIEHSIKRIKRE